VTPDIFEQQVLITRAREEVFAFFSDAANLDRLTPPWLNFRILTPMPVRMEAGTRIRYRLKVHGLLLGWLTEIARWEPPRLFEDVQLQGPYRRWVHQHRFEEVPGGTLMTDRVEYLARGWLLAPVLHRLFIRADVAAIFAYRSVCLERIFGHRLDSQREQRS